MKFGVDRSIRNRPNAMEYSMYLVTVCPSIRYRSCRNLIWTSIPEMCYTLNAQHYISGKALKVRFHNIYLYESIYEIDVRTCIEILEYLLDVLGENFSCAGALHLDKGHYLIRILINGVSFDGHKSFSDNNNGLKNLYCAVRREFGLRISLDFSPDCLFHNIDNNHDNYRYLAEGYI